MRNDRELSIDQLSAVNSGMASTGNGSMSHPKPSPVDELIKWILSKFK